MKYDGKWISEVGIKKYRQAITAQTTASISLLNTPQELERKFKECNFGCHHPGYRGVQKQHEWFQVLRTLDNVDPVLAGIVDGVRDVTYKKVNTLGHGVERTAEGLHLMGAEVFQNVGAENLAVFNSIVPLIEKILNFDMSFFENPIMQVVTCIINEYTSAIPDFIVEKLVEDGSIVFNDGVSKIELLKAISLMVVQGVEAADVNQIYPILEKRGKRMLGKHIGKKLSAVAAAAIATKIAKGMLGQSPETRHIKRELVKIRRGLKSAGGGYSKALLSLLSAQGMLGLAARDSRRLRSESFVLWKTLRLQLNGADMVYFLVRPMVQEYVDRISLLEKNPMAFVEMVKALVKSGDANKIYLLSKL